MEDKPRYSRTTDIMELLILMQSRVQGVTLNDIQKEFNVSRRTAERMRDSLIYAVPQIEEIENFKSREKHWGFPNGYMKEFINFTAQEVANLENLKKFQLSQGYDDKVKILEQTINKIRVLNRKKLPQFDNAIEIIMQTEGFVIHQTPRYKFDLSMLETIREAMAQNKKISAKYNNKNKIIAPFGLIYGSKVYLTGVEEDKGTIPYCYLLHKFSDIKLTQDSFDKGNFNLDEFSKKSFGVYQGECFNVKLLFSKNVAQDVLNYHFHSTQKIKRNEDGTVTVKFKASGDKEILWHLFKWGEDVKILSPSKLKKEYIQMLEDALSNQKEK